MRSEAVAAVVAILLCVCECQNVSMAAGLGEPCTSNEECIQGAECPERVTPRQCSCLDHVVCAQQTPYTACVDSEEGNPMKICQLVPCQSDSNCSHVAGTQCLAADAGGSSCQGTSTDGDKGDEKIDAEAQLEKDFEMYLSIGAVGIGIGIAVAVFCLAFVMSGKCSGDPGSRPIQGRGVPQIKRRIAMCLGGTKPSPTEKLSPTEKIQSKTGLAVQPVYPVEPKAPGNFGGEDSSARPPSDTGFSEASGMTTSEVEESVVSGQSGTSGVSETTGAEESFAKHV